MQVSTENSRNRTKIRIFVASPGDVSEERKSLFKVIERLNRGVADQLGLVLELIRWETHVISDVGRPQKVVFDQFPSNSWDIFIGIIWLRFGSETGETDPKTGKKYYSGTEQEFLAAYNLRKDNKYDWPKVMLYRCTRSPQSNKHFSIKENSKQFNRVTKFFNACDSKGAHPMMVTEFAARREFENKVQEGIEKWLWEFDALTAKKSKSNDKRKKSFKLDDFSWLSALPPVNRKLERELFRQMIKGKNPNRGLIVHSDGEGGWGKSVLLKMFQDDCTIHKTPRTLGLFFDPSDKGGANWASIMNRTALELGESNFPYFLNAYTNLSKDKHDIINIHPKVSNRSSFSETKPLIGLQETQVSMHSERLQSELTDIFMKELHALKSKTQVVWLVDSVDWVDRDTQAWLIKVYGQIAKLELRKLFLVAAGRSRFYYQPWWKNAIQEVNICSFEQASIPELMVLAGLIDRREISAKLTRYVAEELMKKTNGRPLDICLELQRMSGGFRNGGIKNV